MTDDNTSRTCIDRRKFLRSTGVAAAGLSVLPTASARKKRPDTDTYLALAERRTRANWDVHQWRHQLSVHGFDFKYADKAVRVPSGEVGTEKLDKHQTTFHITYTSGSPNWINFEWSLNDGWDDMGASPRDYASIAYDTYHYDREYSYGPNYGKYVSPLVDRNDDSTGNGVVVEYNEDHHSMNTTGQFGSWFEMAVEPTSWTSASQRVAKVDYWHTYDSTSGSAVSDITIQSDGDVIVELSRGNHWQRQKSASESQMDDSNGYTA